MPIEFYCRTRTDVDLFFTDRSKPVRDKGNDHVNGAVALGRPGVIWGVWRIMKFPLSGKRGVLTRNESATRQYRSRYLRDR